MGVRWADLLAAKARAGRLEAGAKATVLSCWVWVAPEPLKGKGVGCVGGGVGGGGLEVCDEG